MIPVGERAYWVVHGCTGARVVAAVRLKLFDGLAYDGTVCVALNAVHASEAAALRAYKTTRLEDCESRAGLLEEEAKRLRDEAVELRSELGWLELPEGESKPL